MCIVAVAERSLKRLPAGRFQYIRVYRCYSQRSLNHLLAGISSIYYSHRLISKKTSAARGRGGPPSHDLSRANNMSLGFTSPKSFFRVLEFLLYTGGHDFRWIFLSTKCVKPSACRRFGAHHFMSSRWCFWVQSAWNHLPADVLVHTTSWTIINPKVSKTSACRYFSVYTCVSWL